LSPRTKSLTYFSAGQLRAWAGRVNSFFQPVFWGGPECANSRPIHFLRDGGSNYAKFREDICAPRFCFRFRQIPLLSFETTVPQKSNLGQISHSWPLWNMEQGFAIIGAPGAGLRFPMCCFVSKLECIKRMWGRKSMTNFAFLTPVKFRRGLSEMSEWPMDQISYILLLVDRTLAGRLESGCQNKK